MKERNKFTWAGCVAAVAIAPFFASCSNSSSGGYVPFFPPVSNLPKLAGEDLDSQAQFAFECVKLMHPKMKEAWPGDAVLSEDKFNLMMVRFTKEDLSDIRMFLVNAQAKNEIPNAPQVAASNPVVKNAIEEMVSRGYEKSEYDGKKVTYVSYCDPSPKEREKYKKYLNDAQSIALDHIDTFYHESFHFYIQGKDWGNPDSKDRDQVYPIDFGPRTYRVLANLMLIRAFDNYSDAAKRAEYYGRAKYWHEKYNSEFGDEFKRISLNDINEGTANFFGKAVIHSIFSNWQPFERLANEALATTLDGESYSLGAVAIALLQKEGRLSESVAKFKENKNTYDSRSCAPVSWLLKDTAAPASYDESQDSADKSKINEWQIKIFGDESKYGKKLKTAIDAYKQGNKVYVIDVSSGAEQSGSYKMTDSALEGMVCNLELQFETTRTSISGLDCFDQKFRLPGDSNLDGIERYMIPVASVDFVEDSPQPTTPVPQFGRGTSTDSSGQAAGPKEWMQNVKAGKITAITPLPGNDVQLKDAAKEKEVYKGTDTAGNVYYIFTELASN